MTTKITSSQEITSLQQAFTHWNGIYAARAKTLQSLTGSSSQHRVSKTFQNYRTAYQDLKINLKIEQAKYLGLAKQDPAFTHPILSYTRDRLNALKKSHHGVKQSIAHLPTLNSKHSLTTQVQDFKAAYEIFKTTFRQLETTKALPQDLSTYMQGYYSLKMRLAVLRHNLPSSDRRCAIVDKLKQNIHTLHHRALSFENNQDILLTPHISQLHSSRNCSQSKPILVVDAKDSGMKWQDVANAVKTLAEKELKDDEGDVRASDYVKKEYFKGVSIAPGRSSPETILLATIGKKIIGFIITAKKNEDRSCFWFRPSDTGYVAYLAVDSKFKKSGIGTKLMLTAMNKTKQLGKRYLTLEYIATAQPGWDKDRCKAKIGFYNSFSTRFAIPMEEKNNMEVSRRLHVHPCYDLQDIDFDSLK
ncbi:MAG: GNAT family N-acetyltransferase [Rhabdochlamydiaceae bacterium]|nr:GNAT family N-acetyltransferase [Rhabdochlamydiaceae bacterium]